LPGKKSGRFDPALREMRRGGAIRTPVADSDCPRIRSKIRVAGNCDRRAARRTYLAKAVSPSPSWWARIRGARAGGESQTSSAILKVGDLEFGHLIKAAGRGESASTFVQSVGPERRMLLELLIAPKRRGQVVHSRHDRGEKTVWDSDYKSADQFDLRSRCS